MGYRLLFTLAVWGVLSGRTWGSLGLTLEKSTIIPELTTGIQQVDIVDLDRDGVADVLACDSLSVVAYSANHDSVLFRFELTPQLVDVRFLFADVNRDSVPDLIIGQYLNYKTRPPDTVCRVDLFDGFSNYQQHDSCYFTIVRSSSQDMAAPFQFISLSAEDYNSDGYDELRVGYHRYSLLDFMGGATRLSSTGETKVFTEFPTALDTTLSKFTVSPITVAFGEGRTLYGVTRYEANLYSNPTTSESSRMMKSAVDIVDGSGQVRATIDENLSLPCASDSVELLSSYRALDVGRFYSTDPSVAELLVAYRSEFRCLSGGVSDFDSTNHNYQLYRVDSSANVSHERDLPELEGFHSARYLNAFPRKLFAFNQEGVYEFDPVDGEITQVGAIPDADTLMWRGGDTGADDFVIGVKGSEVTWYQIDEVTSVEDPPESLPVGFQLGRIYPNPFNAAVTIPVTVPHAGALSLDVVNVLGQHVWRIVDSEVKAGRQLFQWDAGAFGSGIYFIRVTFDGETRTTKAVLLK